MTARDRRLRSTYGITEEEFNAILLAQRGRCAICGKVMTRIEVDHDHRLSGRKAVRGLLCGGRWAGCNRKLGHVDKADWLHSAYCYLTLPPAVAVLNRQHKQQPKATKTCKCVYELGSGGCPGDGSCLAR